MIPPASLASSAPPPLSKKSPSRKLPRRKKLSRNPDPPPRSLLPLPLRPRSPDCSVPPEWLASRRSRPSQGPVSIASSFFTPEAPHSIKSLPANCASFRAVSFSLPYRSLRFTLAANLVNLASGVHHESSCVDFARRSGPLDCIHRARRLFAGRYEVQAPRD